MWGFMTLEHDIEYKKLHGEPDEDLLSYLNLLKGVANLGEIGLQMYDKQFFPVAKLSSPQGVNPDLQKTIRTVVADVGRSLEIILVRTVRMQGSRLTA